MESVIIGQLFSTVGKTRGISQGERQDEAAEHPDYRGSNRANGHHN